MPSIIKSIKDYALSFPVRLITIDARKDLVGWYKRMGFIEFPYNPKDVHGLSDSPERTGGICRVTLLRSADREVGCEESFGIVEGRNI